MGQLRSRAASGLVSAWLSGFIFCRFPLPTTISARGPFPGPLLCSFTSQRRSPLSTWIFLITLVSPEHCLLRGRGPSLTTHLHPGNLCHEVGFHLFLLALGSLPSAQRLTGRGGNEPTMFGSTVLSICQPLSGGWCSKHTSPK